ncbi:MAG TPA: hypothetical protein VL027_12905 [Spongiibacteraceae bacterium]|nr:hypothetical protein [Spongiibacteraceae bacterium]HUH38835.1 hypothetical protein [Spongiibacteraceae bacterium]
MRAWVARYRRWRTPVLGVVATVLLIGAAIVTFDADPRELLEFLLGAVLGLGLLVLVALVAGYLLNRLRRR